MGVIQGLFHVWGLLQCFKRYKSWGCIRRPPAGRFLEGAPLKWYSLHHFGGLEIWLKEGDCYTSLPSFGRYALTIPLHL